MTVSEFERIVRLGLGRAILYLRDQDWQPYRDVILEACLHDQAYDRQLEYDRARYAWDLIQLTSDPSYFRDRLIAALPNSNHCYDTEHMMKILAMVANLGDLRARAAVYARFADYADQGEPAGEDHVVTADGLDGLLFVGEILGRDLPDEDLWLARHVQVRAEEQFGANEVAEALRVAGEHSPFVRRFNQAVVDKRASDGKGVRPTPPLQGVSYSELRRRFDADDKELGQYTLRSWGRHADEAELAAAAKDLLRERKHRTLHFLLRSFAERPFPGPPDKLIRLSQSKNTQIAEAALRALAKVRHPNVRALGLVRLAERPDDDHALAILVKNYEEGDHIYFTQALAATPAGEDIHHIGYDLLYHFTDHPDRDIIPILHQLYERGHCAHCRHRCIDLLETLHALPDDILHECEFDGSFEIRERAKELAMT